MFKTQNVTKIKKNVCKSTGRYFLSRCSV